MNSQRQKWFITAVVASSLCVAGLVTAIGLRSTEKPAGLQGLAFTQPRSPNTYRFNPQPDITAYELAQALTVIYQSADTLAVVKPYMDSMPLSVRRHWLPLEPAAPKHEHD